MVDIDSSSIQDFFSDLPYTVHIEPCFFCGSNARLELFLPAFGNVNGFIYCPDCDRRLGLDITASFRHLVDTWNSIQIEAEKTETDGVSE